MIKPVERAILAAAGTAAAVACVSAGAPTLDETVPLLTLARDPEAWRGREVRTCSPAFRNYPEQGEWLLSLPNGQHSAGIRVLGCAGAAPAPDSNGCVAGRIARRDGSVKPLLEGEIYTVSSATISYIWYLHAQCPAPRRR